MSDIKVTINGAAISKLENGLAKALSQTADEILSRERNDQVIPFGDTGNMQGEDTYVDDHDAAAGHVRIVTDAAQARRLFFNPQYHFRHDKNPNAQGEWWEPWISGARRNDALKIFAGLIKRNAGGVVK